MTRRLLGWIAALLVLLLLGIGLFLATFDLDRYREEIEEALSSTLSRPVELGEASFSIRHGPAVSFSEVELSFDGPAEIRLAIPALLLSLELRPLLEGRLVFSAVELIEPRILVDFGVAPKPPPSAAKHPARSEDRGMLRSTLIRSLSIHDGLLEIAFSQTGERAPLEFFDLEVQVDELSLSREVSGKLRAKLRQPGKAAAFWTEFSVASPSPEDSGLASRLLGVEISAEHLDAERLLQPLSSAPLPGISGRFFLEGTLEGAWRDAFQFTAGLKGQHLQVPLGGETLVLEAMDVRGAWRPDDQRLSLEEVRLQTAQGEMEGRLLLEAREGTTWLEGEASTSPLSLAWLGTIFPGPAKGVPRSGTLEIEHLEVDGPLRDWSGHAAGWPIGKARGELAGALLQLPGRPPVRELRASWNYEPGEFSVAAGRARMKDVELSFSGRVQDPLREAASFDLEASGTFPAGTLPGILPSRPADLEVSGDLPFSIRATGTHVRQNFDLRADLEPLFLEAGNYLRKPPGRAAKLFATLSVDEKRVELDHGRLEITPLELRARGFLSRAPTGEFRLETDLEQADLATLREVIPALERYDPRGQVSLRYHGQGEQGKVTSHGGRIALHQAGSRLVGPLAELNQVSGEVLLQEEGASFQGVSGRLGESPLSASGKIRYAGPEIDLQVASQALRARDLVFPSTRQVFQGVRGHLTITRSEVQLDSVRFVMPRGTLAEVRGKVSRFRAPLVDLEVEAEEAVIDEVVSLWRDAESKAPSRKPGPKRPVEVRVAARVTQGALGFSGPIGNLSFQEAEGTVLYQDGVLTVHPLSFDSGPGYYVGRVAMDGGERGPRRLKVSGHLENFDAAAFYQDLLQRRGLIIGTLRGDFYLEGDLGGRFLETSLGGIDVRVEDGVLRRFNFLSKVFSLLNVSQILTLQLPDMSTEGMPFSKLTGSFSLEGGELVTEDLFVESNAMNLSLVGSYRLQESEMDFVLGVKPLRTVDRIITRIPVAGWLLTGEEKALVTAHFEIKGPAEDPRVTPLPITSVSEKVLGVFKRVFGLPEKMIRELGGDSAEE